MALSQMAKIQIVGHNSAREEEVEELQRLGLVEITAAKHGETVPILRQHCSDTSSSAGKRAALFHRVSPCFTVLFYCILSYTEIN